jgi:hypothetical protein
MMGKMETLSQRRVMESPTFHMISWDFGWDGSGWI